MADVSNAQTSFLGGEWSMTAQGMMDHPKYKTGMNVCVNSMPLEEGAWIRRPGMALAGPTWHGTQTYLFPFSLLEGAPYRVEVGQGVTRIWSGTNHVFDSQYEIYAIQNTTPLTISVDPAAPYVTGDTINILLTSGPNGALAKLQNEDFQLVQVSTGIYQLLDPITGGNISPNQNNWNGTTMTAVVARVLVLSNPYVDAADPSQVNVCMAGSQLVMFHPLYPTQQITLNGFDAADQRFSIFSSGVWLYSDGPYYPSVFGQVATPNAQSGTITLSLSGGFGPRGAATSSDVGKLVRLLSEPLLWQSGTTYSLHQNVLYPAGTGEGPGNYYTSLINSNTGNTPSSSPADWAIDPTLAQWSWGIITNVLNGAEIQITLGGNSPTLDYANPINYWNLGLFGGVDGWPTAGTVHEGRLIPVYSNYFLASRTQAAATSYNDMAPTDINGNVDDSSAISYQLSSGSENSNQLFWAESGQTGLMMGSPAGEWNIQASNLNDPLTPTSIQAHRVTKYGCANVQPARSGFSVLFVQRFAQRVLELFSDVFTSKFAAPNLTLRARHIGRPGFLQVQWAETPNPILWTIDKIGGWAGVTYRRLTSFISEEATFVGWHRHTLGLAAGGATVRPVASIAVTPTTDGTSDCLGMVAPAAVGAGYVVLQQGRYFTEGDTLDSSYFLDDSRAPTAIVDTGAGSVVLSGFYPLSGLPVTAFITGLNCGSYTVDSTGSITVPYGSDPDGLFTQARLLSYPATGEPGLSTGFAKVISTPPPSYSSTPATVGEYASATASTTVTYTDWGFGYFYFADGSANFLKSYNITTRAQLASISMPADTNIAGANSGYLYVQANGEDYGAIGRYDNASLTYAAVFGTSANGTFSPYVSVTCGLIHGSYAIVAAGDQFLVGMASNLGSNEIWVVDLTQGLYAGFDTTALPNAMNLYPAVTGTQGSVLCVSTGTAASLDLGLVTIGATAVSNIVVYDAWSSGDTYSTGEIVVEGNDVWVATGNNTAGQQPGVSGNWSVYSQPNNGSINYSTTGALAATSIDAGWTTFTMEDVGYDQVDGNFIGFCAIGAGSGAHTGYLVKFTFGGTILWKIGVPGLSAFGISQSLINNGTFSFIDNADTVYAINTETGAINLQFTIPGLSQTPSSFSQVYNGSEKQLFSRYAYNSGTTGAPTPLSGTSSTFTDWAVYSPFSAYNPIAVAITSVTLPALVGIPFVSQGQRLRPGTPQEAGAANGPPLGKTRRNHMQSVLMNNTPALAIGTSFTLTPALPRPMIFKTPGGTVYPASTAFSGVEWGQIDDQYSFDGMICWQVSGTYPAIVAAVGGFVHTMDR